MQSRTPTPRAKILNASAGSGKTYQLAYKYVRDVIENPMAYSHILAVTFTNKATEEMKSRILKEIHTLASGRPSSYLASLQRELGLSEAQLRERALKARTLILHNYSRFTVLTIDRFFQRILRAFIKELGIELNYNVEIETASVLTKSADALIDRITADPELHRWLTEFVGERIDEGARWDIRDGILALGDELFKERNKEALAADGAKERLERIVGEATRRYRATREALRETAQRAVALLDAAGAGPQDFNNGRFFIPLFRAYAAGDFKAPSKSAVERSLSTEKWVRKGGTTQALAAQLQPLLHTLCDGYARHIKFWNTVELMRENYRSFALLADLYAQVRTLCDEQNVMLLSETKHILSQFIARNDAPFIYEKVGNRFDRFMIDEFQDTSRKEWENFLPLLQNAMAQSDTTSVLLVGDIKQSIYRWRGGDWQLLHRGAAEALGAGNVETVPLQENYRSLRRVVDFNNRIIDRIVALDTAALEATLTEAAEAGALPAGSARQLAGTLSEAYAGHTQRACKRSREEGCVRIATYTGEPPLVERICEILDRGFRPCDIMILVRTKGDGARVAETLLDFKRRNTEPRYRFDVMTQEALVIGNAPISAFLTAVLRLTVDPDDAIRRAIFNRWLGRPFEAPLTAEERNFLGAVRLLSPEEAFERIVLHYRLDRVQGEVAYLQAIHEQIIGFSSGRVADIPLFLAWWDEQGAARSLSVEQSDSTIEITTIHKAKGLEKRVVVIPYCNWPLNPKASGRGGSVLWAEPQTAEGIGEVGRFPVRCKSAMAQSFFSEEYYRELVYAHVDNINLLYVALTRAVEALHLFIPCDRRGPHVGELILGSLSHDGPTARLGDATGSYTAGEEGEEYLFGTFSSPEPETAKSDARRQIVLHDYPTACPDLRLRLPSDRYFEPGEASELAPRNMGILLHRAFQEAASSDEIFRNIARLEEEALLSPTETDALRRRVEKALRDPLIGSWFDASWEEVRNENDILLPGSGALRRPDRVMRRGTSCVVVDYKFGLHEEERHRSQVREYMRLLRAMGHTEVKGYLWYVRAEHVAAVDDL